MTGFEREYLPKRERNPTFISAGSVFKKYRIVRIYIFSGELSHVVKKHSIYLMVYHKQ